MKWMSFGRFAPQSGEISMRARRFEVQTSPTSLPGRRAQIGEMDEFRKFFTPDNENHPEIHGGFALVHWAGGAEEEEALQKELKVTIRCIPKDPALRGEAGTCIYTGKPAEGRVIFAKSY